MPPADFIPSDFNDLSGTVAAAQLPASGVTPGTYALATVTVDTHGRVTAASAGSASAPVTSVAGRTGAVVLSTADVSGLDADLAAKAGLGANAFTGDQAVTVNSTAFEIVGGLSVHSGSPDSAMLGFGSTSTGETPCRKVGVGVVRYQSQGRGSLVFCNNFTDDGSDFTRADLKAHVHSRGFAVSSSLTAPGGGWPSFCVRDDGTGNSLFYLIGGNTFGQIWKDEAGAFGGPTKAVGYGMSVGGGAVTDDWVVSTFDGSAWHEGLRVKNATGELVSPGKHTFTGQSGTNPVHDLGYLDAGFADATDATYRGFVALSARGYTGFVGEGIRVTAHPTSGLTYVSFFGAGTGAVRQDLTGDTTADLAALQAVVKALLVALNAYGLITDSTT